MHSIFIYWIDKYVGGYRKGVSHASIDGLNMLCGRKTTPMNWDGGYQNVEELKPECKNCLKALKKLM